jgi:hypothetical protein
MKVLLQQDLEDQQYMKVLLQQDLEDQLENTDRP